ncbi:DUF6492 family protein [Cellulomonas sp. URHE0023]|uniref:DUF6492 family protein n=1 Tax=Cellulomonas sp. URHE0023 TaxID=1380354 RepID=UPI00048A0132|nr:DUF6492 family protein [Cellulomonas sp. URHE0023]
MEPVTVVTVCFEAELQMVELQARSLGLYLDPEHVTSVLLLDNSRSGLAPAFVDRLLPAYGALADRVEVVRAGDVAPLPSAAGWRTQQILKLEVARRITSSRYVALDAKNHLIAPARPDFFEAADGRALVTSYSYATHPLQPSLRHVLTYLGLDPEPHVSHFPATVTPYLLDTRVVLSLLDGLSTTRTFADEFARNDLTEFFLYAGWQLKDGTLEERYDLSGAASPVVWPGGATAERVARTIDAARTGRSPFFSVHRNALPRLDDDARAMLADLWADRGLVANRDDGQTVLAAMTEQQRAHSPRRTVGDVPRLARVAARRALRRVRRAAP